MTIFNKWYVSSTGNHQGLVVDESTGGNIAVTYDKDNAPLVAAAPDMLSTLRFILEDANTELDYEARLIIESVISKATQS